MAGVCVLMLLFVLSECNVYSRIKSDLTNGKEESGLQQKDKTNQICSELVQTTDHKMTPRGGGRARGLWTTELLLVVAAACSAITHRMKY
jgi:hypothetical protein